MAPKKRKLYVPQPEEMDPPVPETEEREAEPEESAPVVEAVLPAVEAPSPVPTVVLCKNCGVPYKGIVINSPEYSGTVCAKCRHRE